MQKIWERRADESSKAFGAFKTYLFLSNRSCTEVAKMQHKTPQHIRRWASKYDWQERAAAWDNSLIEEARQSLKIDLPAKIKTQWQTSGALLEQAAAALAKKDMSAAGFRSLAEIYTGAANLQLKIIEMLKLLESDNSDTEKNLTINIVAADKPKY